MAATRKRMRAAGTLAPRKRARFSQKWTRRGRRMRAFTGTGGQVWNPGYRSRRVRGRRWRSILWRDTTAQNHFRSTRSLASAAAAPLLVTQKFIDVLYAAGTNTGIEPFWTPLGGLLPIDATTPTATFSGDKIIRGGKIKIDVTNLSDQDSIKVQAWLVFVTLNPAVGVITPYVAPAAVAREFDPSHIPDFKRYGRVVLQRETILLPESRPWSVEYRLRPQKVDTNTWLNGGSQFVWFITQSSYSETDATVNTLQVVRSYSLSFASDVVTEVP